MSEKALESFMNTCDEMMVPVEEGLINRTKIRLSKVKLKDGEENWSNIDTGITYQGAPVKINGKMENMKNPNQKTLITKAIRKIIANIDKVYKKEYDNLVTELLHHAPACGMNNVKTKADLEKIMKLNIITSSIYFESKKNKSDEIDINSNDIAIGKAYVEFWFNYKPNKDFFEGHACILAFDIQKNKVVKVSNMLAESNT